MADTNGVKSSLWKTVSILTMLLVAVATFAVTNFSLSDKLNSMTAVDNGLDKRISVQDERISTLSRDIAEIKESQKEMLSLLRRNESRFK